MKKYIISMFTVVICLFTLIVTTVSAESSFLSVNDTIEIDKDITLNIDLSLIEYDIFRLDISSNKSLDTLSMNNIGLNTSDDGLYFEYNINVSNVNKLVLNYKLPSNTNVGDKITFYMKLTNKENEEETSDVRKTITVIDSKNKPQEDNNNNNKPSNFKPSFNISNKTTSNFNTSSSFPKTNIASYPGSDNNYLKNLSVKGYSLHRKFSKDGLTYFVTVKNSVKSVKINTKADSSKSSVVVSGNDNLSVGLNKVLVSVTSESGLIRNYKIYVTRKSK